MKKFDQNYDWDNIPIGSTFTARIQGRKVSGRISKRRSAHRGYGDVIFLCQNVKDGAFLQDRLGYKYSWTLGHVGKDAQDPKKSAVTELYVWLPEDGYIAPHDLPTILQVVGNYNIRNVSGSQLTVGCTTIKFKHVEAIYNHMLKLQKSGL